MIQKIGIGLRILLCTLGAVVLLYVLSYPDSLIPERPEWSDLTGWRLIDFKPIMFLAPLLFMELVGAMGARRNLVWFSSLGLVLVGGIIAWPILEGWRPELVHATFDYEVDGKLSFGLAMIAIIIVISIVNRLVLLTYLFPEPELIEEDDVNSVDAVVLDPSKGRTVKEIATTHKSKKPRFLYGDADMGLVNRFLQLMHNIGLTNRYRLIALAVLALVVGSWFFLYPRPTEEEAWQRDIARMYEHTGSGENMRATHPAIHAAWRVLEKVSRKEMLGSMTHAQAEEALRMDLAAPAYKDFIRHTTTKWEIRYVDDVLDSRDKFLTLTDGMRYVILFVRTNLEGDIINISETQENGWNSVHDEERRNTALEYRLPGFHTRTVR